VVVDNGSSDDSVARIHAAHPEVPILATGRNLGFSGGNNVGIREVMNQNVDYVWLLNNDTELLPETLGELVRAAETDISIGAVGSVLFYAFEPDRIQTWGGGWTNRWTGYVKLATAPPRIPLHFLTAASLLLRGRALREVGLMDDRFFLYWEDVELCFRLRRHFWKLAVAPEAVVFHKVNASSKKHSTAIVRYSTCSGLRFLAEYSFNPVLCSWAFLGFRLGHRVAQGRFNAIRSVLRGVQDFRDRDRSAELPVY
jgi:GT2 family glycosyltransferase